MKRFGQRCANKYGAKKVIIDDIKFDSIAEGEFYLELKTYESVGAIKILKLQPKVYLSRARILYKPDFLIQENGKDYYIDVKGMETQGFKLKAKLWKAYGPAPLRIIKRKGSKFFLDKTIIVKDKDHK